MIHYGSYLYEFHTNQTMNYKNIKENDKLW